jgi:hypothetical protein
MEGLYEKGRLAEKDPPRFQWRVWLAVDRNWIPAQTQCYSYEGSGKPPRLEILVVVEKWTELAPQLCLPRRIVRTDFHPKDGSKSTEVVPKSRTLYEVVEAKLNPNYDPEFFRIEFPPGLLVYRIKDGKIVDSFRVPARQWRWRGAVAVIGVVIIGCIALIAFVWLRRARKRSEN